MSLVESPPILPRKCAMSSEARRPEQRFVIISQMQLVTDRLILRRWQVDDRMPFAQMNADPIVMEHFPSILSRSESDAFADRIEAGFDTNGFGLFAVEIVAGDRFIGFVGLALPSFNAHFTPAVEIGWRLNRTHWGYGYATEAARACVEFAFTDIGLDELVSFTVPQNAPSRLVMERIGMTHDTSDDFDHPLFSNDHRMGRQVLYRLTHTHSERLRIQAAAGLGQQDGATIHEMGSLAPQYR